MSPQRSPGSHLYPANGLHAASGLGQTRITSSLPALSDGVLEVLGLLPQLLEFVHGVPSLWYRGGWCSLARCAEDPLLSLPHLSSQSAAICYLTKSACPPVIVPLGMTPHL